VDYDWLTPRRQVRGAKGCDMTLMEQISSDIAAAMKAREAERLAALRMAKAALMNREVEKGRTLEAAEEQQVIVSLIKQRRDSIEQFRQGGRQELADREAAEIAHLETYLPPPLDDAALEAAVQASIAETGATSPKDMGKVMKAVMPRLAGHAVDGRVVSDIVKRILSA
jgi:uncharacterized protein